jgi:hypothetical protein
MTDHPTRHFAGDQWVSYELLTWMALGPGRGIARQSAWRVHGPFPAPLMTTIAGLGSFLAPEQAAAGPPPLITAGPILPPAATATGTDAN